MYVCLSLTRRGVFVQALPFDASRPNAITFSSPPTGNPRSLLVLTLLPFFDKSSLASTDTLLPVQERHSYVFSLAKSNRGSLLVQSTRDSSHPHQSTSTNLNSTSKAQKQPESHHQGRRSRQARRIGLRALSSFVYSLEIQSLGRSLTGKEWFVSVN